MTRETRYDNLSDILVKPTALIKLSRISHKYDIMTYLLNLRDNFISAVGFGIKCDILSDQ